MQPIAAALLSHFFRLSSSESYHNWKFLGTIVLQEILRFLFFSAWVRGPTVADGGCLFPTGTENSAGVVTGRRLRELATGWLVPPRSQLRQQLKGKGSKQTKYGPSIFCCGSRGAGLVVHCHSGRPAAVVLGGVLNEISGYYGQ